MNTRRIVTSALAGASLLALSPSVAMAQDAPAAEVAEDDENVIIVTGTSAARTAQNTPLSIALVDEGDLRTFAGSGSQADILQQLPGLKTEGGGGEVATNFRVRGLPSAGQFEFTPINYDGVTVLSSFGLNSSAFDFFARNDLGIERLEFVKGGVSNLFGVSSTAGIINYITKTGTEELHGTIQLEVGEDNRYRGDFAVQGPLGENTFFAISGFYRYDEGPIDTGQPTEGFALRANLRQEFADGSGSFTLYGTYIDDRANFYLPLPLDGSTRERIAGNNGQTVFSTNVSDLDGVTIPTPEGRTTLNVADGFFTQGGSVAAVFEKEFGNGWAVDAKIKYSSYESSSNFFNNGIGPASPETQAQFLARNNLTGVALFRDVRSGQALGANDLVYNSGYNNRERPTTDGTLELNLTKELIAGSTTHNITLGTFISRAEADNNQRSVQFISQFNNDPGLVELTINGQQFTVGGITRGLSAYTNEERSAFKRAIYLADQIEGDRWSFDIGGRIETATIKNRFELTSTIASTLAANPVPGAPITTQVFGTGQFREGEATTTGWSIAAGGLYQLTDNLNIYANASRGFFFPQAQGTNGQINSTGDIQVFEPEPIYQAEAGLKFRNSDFNGYIAAFYTGLRNRTSVSFVGANLTPQLLFNETDTFGVELDANYRVTDFLSLSGNFTYQDAKFVGQSPANILGNEPDRLPSILFNLGAQANTGKFDASVFWNYQGDTFQDATNNVPLFAYGIVRADAGYNFGNDENKVRLSVGVWNLLNSQGLAEGNPRAGAFQVTPDGNAAFFNGRPILPRRFVARLTFDF